MGWTVLFAMLLTLFGPALAVAEAVSPDQLSAAAADHEAEFIALVNRERARSGLNSLIVATDIRNVARAHSRVMAERHDNDVAPALHHNPDFSTQITGWRIVAENVGHGASVESLHTALMHSKAHRDNILDPRLTEIGVGVEYRGGRIWVTQNFRLPEGQAVIAAASSTAFGDVLSTSVHAAAIDRLTTAGIADGCTGARFCPGQAVSRGEFAAMLARAMGFEPLTPVTFLDTSGETAGYIEALYAAGIASGTSAVTFDPNRRLTREQAASFMARALELTPQASPFRDTSSAHDGNVGALHARGLVRGYSIDRFGASDLIIRAQAATILHREFS